jgi:hypothetical protein
MSLLSDRRCRADSRMSCRYSTCLSLSSPEISSVSSCENPMTGRIGFGRAQPRKAAEGVVVREAVDVAVAARDESLLRAAEPRGVLDQRIENRLELERSRMRASGSLNRRTFSNLHRSSLGPAW